MTTMVSSPFSTNGDDSLWASSRNFKITSHPSDPDFGVRKGLLGVHFGLVAHGTSSYFSSSLSLDLSVVAGTGTGIGTS